MIDKRWEARLRRAGERFDGAQVRARAEFAQIIREAEKAGASLADVGRVLGMSRQAVWNVLARAEGRISSASEQRVPEARKTSDDAKEG